MKFRHLMLCSAWLAGAMSAQAGIVVTNAVDADTLAAALAGSGVVISNAVFTSNGTANPAGLFSGGAALGVDSGVVLTTGSTSCVAGPNNDDGCSGNGSYSSLKFDFTSSTGKLFFNYVFASEEYNYYVNQGYNDSFQLLLNGVNIALLPNGDAVTIDNVNCGKNTAYYLNNTDESAPAGCKNLNIDIQYDGLTTVLQASANVGTGLNTFEFLVKDIGDDVLDSAVFVQAGSFSGTSDLPEPGTLALAGLALAAAAGVRRFRA